MRKQVLLVLMLLLLGACSNPFGEHRRQVSSSFYYWKTVFKLSTSNRQYLQQLQVKTLYLRIMDVDLDELSAQPVPVQPISFAQPVPPNMQIVPVVFIVNQALKQTTNSQLPALANKIVYFVNGKLQQGGAKHFNELQIDCDWTAQTRDRYFELLRQIKHCMGIKTLSVTLRLHQLKNQNTCGVPPANRVMLMCYNMGNLRQYGTQNSIINPDEIEKYMSYHMAAYPMPIDAAMPLFSWAVVFRNKQYVGLTKRVKFNTLQPQNNFTLLQQNLYLCQADMPQLGLLQGDVIRWEQSPVDDLNHMVHYLRNYLPNDANINLTFFDLDDELLKNYPTAQLQNLVAGLR